MLDWEWRMIQARPVSTAIDVGGLTLRVGDRVELRPRGAGNILDFALTGKIATIDAIDQDDSGRHRLSVLLDDDAGRAPWGRSSQTLFFSPTEVVPLDPRPAPPDKPVEPGAPRVLVAGVGNIFLGDNGFGVEVARRLSERDLPRSVRVVDFGVRSFDLACAFDTADAAILVDTFPHGKPPGDLMVVEPDLEAPEAMAPRPEDAAPHGVDPASVLRLARRMRTLPARLLLVGCEPETVGGIGGTIGLSPAVRAAVDNAVCLVETLATDLASGTCLAP